MKNLMIIIYVLVFADVHSQNMKVTYNNRILIDSTQLENADSFTREDLLEQAKGDTYELLIKNGESLYEPLFIKQGKNGTSVTSDAKGNSSISHKYYESIYRDKKQHKMVSSIGFGGETFLIHEKLEPIDWEITEETKQIDSYVAKKAEAMVDGFHVVVWFTDEIPISEGPSYYWGLPGLVLQAQFGKILITAMKIERLPDGIAIAPPTEGEKYTREEYDDLLNSAMNVKEGTTRKGNTTTTITRH